MSDFEVAFEDENSKFGCKILIINRLLKYLDFSKNCVRRVFLSILENFVFA